MLLLCCDLCWLFWSPRHPGSLELSQKTCFCTQLITVKGGEGTSLSKAYKIVSFVRSNQLFFFSRFEAKLLIHINLCVIQNRNRQYIAWLATHARKNACVVLQIDFLLSLGIYWLSIYWWHFLWKMSKRSMFKMNESQVSSKIQIIAMGRNFHNVTQNGMAT